MYRTVLHASVYCSSRMWCDWFTHTTCANYTAAQWFTLVQGVQGALLFSHTLHLCFALRAYSTILVSRIIAHHHSEPSALPMPMHGPVFSCMHGLVPKKSNLLKALWLPTFKNFNHLRHISCDFIRLPLFSHAYVERIRDPEDLGTMPTR